MAINYGANYTGIDKERYDAGNQFYSQDRFLQGTGLDKPAITFNPSRSNTGIMGAYNPYPIIPQYGSDGDGGGPIGPGGNSKFDYEYEALGGLNNPNNVALTEEEQKTLNMQKAKDAAKMAGKLGMFALNPFASLANKFGRAGIRNYQYQKEEKQRMEEFQQQKEARNRVDDIMSSQQTQQDFYDSLNDGAGATSTASSRSEAGTDDTAGTPFQYGGRAGYRDGGLTKYEVFKLGELGYNTKGGTVLEPFGGINVLRDILRVNKYAYGGIVGLYR